MFGAASCSFIRSSNVSMPVKRRIRFREEDDIALLREVAGQNPFANPEVWNTVKQHLLLLTGKDFSIKTLKDHLDLIIKMWLEKTKINTFKSGTEEDYNEKEQLCQDVYDAMTQFRNKQKKCTKKKILENAGKTSRDEWANNSLVSLKFGCDMDTGATNVEDNSVNSIKENLLPDHEYCNFIAREECVSSNSAFLNSTLDERENVKVDPQITVQSTVLKPVRARKRKMNVQRQGISYLEQYDKNQIELKRKEQLLEERRISLEEKKLLLAEKKFELEDFERRKNLEILENRLVHDVEERRESRMIIERQEKIIETLILQMKK